MVLKMKREIQEDDINQEVKDCTNYAVNSRREALMITKIGVITSILGFELKLPVYFIFIEWLKM